MGYSFGKRKITILLLAAITTCYYREMRDALNGHINHSRALKWKVVSCIPAGILFTIYLTGWPLMWNWLTILASGKSAIFTGSWFMFLFNAAWGLKVDKDPFYRSTAIGKNLPRFDRMVLHWPKWVYILFVLAVVTGATIFYFK